MGEKAGERSPSPSIGVQQVQKPGEARFEVDLRAIGAEQPVRFRIERPVPDSDEIRVRIHAVLNLSVRFLHPLPRNIVA
ncbi:MAG: hypothetical protein ACRD2Z_07285 [Thermoanaerobaculia bacterium]